MKDRPVLQIAIILTLIVEFTLMVLVYTKIGNELLLGQIGRVFFQLIFIAIVLIRKSNIALFVLAGYHILVGLYSLYMNNSPDFLVIGLGLFHLLIGLIIYFHDEIEKKLI